MNSIDAVYELLKAADPVDERLDDSPLVARVETEIGFDTVPGLPPAEEKPAGPRITRWAPVQAQRPALRPTWAAAFAFAATVLTLGGSLALGAAMREPMADAGSTWGPGTVGEVVAATSGRWLLIPVIGVVTAIAAALVVMNRQGGARKERVMATTIETPPAERLEAAERSNRWLIAVIVFLAVALVALGAWVIYDAVSEPETAASSEINALYDDYVASWEEADTQAFFDLTTENYAFNDSSRTQQSAAIELGGGLSVERIGDLLVMGDGPYYLVAAEQLTYLGRDHVGVSAYTVIETEDGLKVAEHSWHGNL